MTHEQRQSRIQMATLVSVGGLLALVAGCLVFCLRVGAQAGSKDQQLTSCLQRVDRVEDAIVALGKSQARIETKIEDIVHRFDRVERKIDRSTGGGGTP